MTTTVKLPASLDYPLTLSNIGGDPDNSRTISKAGNVRAKDRDELQALLSVGGELVDDEPDPAAPAVSPTTTPATGRA